MAMGVYNFDFKNKRIVVGKESVEAGLLPSYSKIVKNGNAYYPTFYLDDYRGMFKTLSIVITEGYEDDAIISYFINDEWLHELVQTNDECRIVETIVNEFSKFQPDVDEVRELVQNTVKSKITNYMAFDDLLKYLFDKEKELADEILDKLADENDYFEIK